MSLRPDLVVRRDAGGVVFNDYAQNPVPRALLRADKEVGESE